MKRYIAWFLFILVLLSACARPSPSPTPSAPPATATPQLLVPEPVLKSVHTQAAADLGVEAEALTLVSAEPVDWPDTSLGCPQPDMMYAQVIIPGWRLVFQDAAGQTYEIHTDQTGEKYVRCGGALPQEPVLEPSLDAEINGLRAVAERYGVSEGEVRLIYREAVQWPDSCLGCAAPNVMCLMVITPGYRLTYEVNGKKVEVHTNQDGTAVTICGDSGLVQEGHPLTDKAFVSALDFILSELPGYGLAQWPQDQWTPQDVTPDGLIGGVRYRYGADLWSFEVQCPVVERPICDVTLSHQAAGRVWRGVVDADGLVRTGDARPALNVTVTPCDQNAGIPATGASFEANVKDGQIIVAQTIAYVCCADIKVALGWDGDARTIKFIESNLGEVCRCLCAYPMQATVGPLPTGTYRLEVWGVQKTDAGHPLELLHSMEVKVP